MIDALSITWRGLKDLWEEFAFLLVLDVLWSLAAALTALPWFVLTSAPWPAILALSLLLSLPLAAHSGALCFVANQVTRGIAVNWATFRAGLRRYWKKAVTVALVNWLVLLLLVSNLRFYGTVLEGAWTNWALGIWLVALIYWLLAQIFWFPMILELESEKVLPALRNALLLVFLTPGFSVALGLVLLVLGILCTVLTVPAVLVFASLALLIANHATRSRLARVKKVPYEPVDKV